MTEAGWIQVTTTGPKEIAERIAAAAVTERLAACAQIVGPVSSTFRWRGAVDTAIEWYCHLKTSRSQWPALEARIRAIHSYELPEIIAVPIVEGSPEYLAWIEQQVEARPGRGARE